MTAGALALWIGMGFAALAAWAGATARASDARAGTAARALAMGAVFGTVSLGLLLDALRRGDLTVDYVARHTILALPPSVRLLAIGADASGAGLLVAAVTLAIGAWVARRADTPGTAAAVGVVALVLLAAPLAGRPHEVLSWLPVDGQDALPAFRERLAWPWMAAVVGGVSAATLALGRAIDAWRGEANPGASWLPALVSGFFVALQVMTGLQVTIAAGVSRDLSPLTAHGGVWGLALLVSVVVLMLVGASATPARARVAAAVAQVLATVGLVLSPIGAPATAAVRSLLLLALGIAAVAAWDGREALLSSWREARRDVQTRRPTAILAALALGLALLACLAGVAASAAPVTLASGGTVASAAGPLDHLGVSRYDRDDATVLALALERRGGGRTALASAEHREYTDARGAVLGTLLRLPAQFTGPVTAFAWLERVTDADGAELLVATRPDWVPWWAALACLALYLAVMLAGPGPARR